MWSSQPAEKDETSLLAIQARLYIFQPMIWLGMLCDC